MDKSLIPNINVPSFRNSDNYALTTTNTRTSRSFIVRILEDNLAALDGDQSAARRSSQTWSDIPNAADGVARVKVRLKFMHQPIYIEQIDDVPQSYAVGPKADLKTYLTALLTAARAGDFDDQLTAIKAKTIKTTRKTTRH